MEKNFKRTLVTTALPYANGPVHIGHLAGVYVPADIYTRYLRLKGEDVIMIGGSDEHGVPITIKAKAEGVTPQDIVDRYHNIIKKSFEEFGISFDIYSRTTSKIHSEMASDFFRLLMVVVSYPLISILLKEQWVPSVPYFRLLCFSGICSPFIILFFDLFNSLGYSRLNLQLEIGKKIYLFAGIALFYSSGILWLIGWWISYSVLSLAASIFFARRFLGYGFGEYVKDIFPYFILALASAILSCGVYLLLPSDLWRLCLVPVVYVVLYLGGAYMLKLEMLQEMLSMLKSRVKRGGEA